jgi:hypothetical protein
MLSPELVIAANGRIDGHTAILEGMGELWANRRDLRPETAEKPFAELAERRIGRIGVIGELIIEIARDADHCRLRQPLRGTPIEVHVDAVLVVLALGVLEVVGEAQRGRQLVAGFRIEVGIGAAAVDGAMADAYIGEAFGIVIADGNVVRGIELVVIDTLVPGNAVAIG